MKGPFTHMFQLLQRVNQTFAEKACTCVMYSWIKHISNPDVTGLRAFELTVARHRNAWSHIQVRRREDVAGCCVRAAEQGQEQGQKPGSSGGSGLPHLAPESRGSLAPYKGAHSHTPTQSRAHSHTHRIGVAGKRAASRHTAQRPAQREGQEERCQNGDVS